MLFATRLRCQLVLVPLVIALVAVLAPFEAFAFAAKNNVDLESLCADKAVELTRASQIKALIGEIESRYFSMCTEKARSALRDLDALISSIDGNVCSLESVGKIRDYYETYISSVSKNEIPLPRALKKFVIAYGLQVSKVCKKTMINSLTLDAKTLLKEEDHKLIAPWTAEQSVLSQLMSEPSDYDDILLPRDLARVIQETRDKEEGGAEQDDNKLYIQTTTNQVIKKMQAICQRRFRPIYQQLILPLIYLSNMGFNYQGEVLERELEEMKINKDIHLWYRIVYLCEPLNDIELVEDSRDADLTEGTDQKLVRILTKEEADKIRAESHEGSTHDAAAEAPELSNIKQLEYKQEDETFIADEILDASDKSLVKLVKKFDTYKSELQRIQGKLISKLTKFMINKLKHGQFNVIGSLMGGKTSQENGHEVHSANSEIVSALDEYVQHQKAPDGPVAGKLGDRLGVAKRYYHQTSVDGFSSIGQKAAKSALQKNMRWYFWYGIATLLFILGIIAVCSVG